jgi:uncharacterized protein (TIGR02145 family)
MNLTIKNSRTTVFLLISIFMISSCKKPGLPTVTTGTVSHILQTTATAGGQVSNDGGATVVAKGVCWNTSLDPTVSNNTTSDSIGVGSFTSHLTGLSAKTVYYLRAYAINSEGTVYGSTVTFTTLDEALPTVTTSSLKSTTLTSASGGGGISNDGGVDIIARGVCWNTTGGPTLADSFTSDGTGKGAFRSSLTDLVLGTTYYVRAYATNSLGTAYGDDVLFIQAEPILDYDGNAYSAVTIGTRIWMGENLSTTTLNDGTSIANITGGTNWANTLGAAYCWYNNDESGFKVTYGALYNWYAVNTGKLCPTGWHVPNNEEFTDLVATMGGELIAGGKLKEAGTIHWADPNLGATNGSGFTALPGGGRYNVYSEPGVFSDAGYFEYIWSSTVGATSGYAYSYNLGYNLELLNKSEYSVTDGGAVRCIKDSK